MCKHKLHFIDKNIFGIMLDRETNTGVGFTICVCEDHKKPHIVDGLRHFYIEMADTELSSLEKAAEEWYDKFTKNNNCITCEDYINSGLKYHIGPVFSPD